MASDVKYNSGNDFEFFAVSLEDSIKELYKDTEDKIIINSQDVISLHNRLCASNLTIDKFYKEYKKKYDHRLISSRVVLMYYDILQWIDKFNDSSDVESWIDMVKQFTEYYKFMKKCYFIDFPVSYKFKHVSKDKDIDMIEIDLEDIIVEISIENTTISNPLHNNIALSMMLHDKDEFVRLIKIKISTNDRGLLGEHLGSFDFISEENINIKELSDNILLNNTMTSINRSIKSDFISSLKALYNYSMNGIDIILDLEDTINHGIWVSKE